MHIWFLFGCLFCLIAALGYSNARARRLKSIRALAKVLTVGDDEDLQRVYKFERY